MNNALTVTDSCSDKSICLKNYSILWQQAIIHASNQKNCFWDHIYGKQLRMIAIVVQIFYIR